MRNFGRSIIATSCMFASLTIPAVASSSKPPAYLGTWGTSLADCKQPLDAKDGPAVLTEKDYVQYQTHCTFGPLVYHRYAWHTKAVCDTAGTKQDDSLDISVSGDALMLVWGKSQATVDYARCK